MTMKKLLVSLLLLALSSAGVAQKPPKRPAGATAPITIFVDATEAPRKILHATLTIPAQPGPLTLVYPKWIPGEHGPDGPINDLAGLKFSAGGKEIAWRRDLVDMFAFHLTVPAGATSVEASLDYLEPAGGSFSAGGSATEQMFVLSWNQVVLYPAGMTARQVTFQPNLRLPAGWKFGSALDLAGGAGGPDVEFQPVTLETLVDSPVIAGRYFRAVPLGGDPLRHQIDMAADSEAALNISPELTQKYTNLVVETGLLFGARHYRHYEFLLTLSDHTAHFGLEHHQSSDDRVAERSLIDEDGRMQMSGLLPHEMVHSWNGKFRRPAGLATPDYQQPMKGDLLWVYEGLTTYLGYVLTGRSGLLTPQQSRDNLAMIAAGMDARNGRTWRNLQDTADAAQDLFRRNPGWITWRRSTDFYDESLLIWLEADTIIRQQTGNKKSLDDFTQLFHGGKNNGPEVVPYTFDDVVTAMNQVTPYDWRKFFSERLESHGPHAPLGGIAGSGWKLVYTAQRSPLEKMRERRSVNLTYSIGLSVAGGEGADAGNIVDVTQGSPAAMAGIGPGMRLVAVNGRRFTADVLHAAVAATKDGGPLELLTENNDYFQTHKVDYRGGEMYPHLERDESHPDLLSDILMPHAPQVSVK
jgi:predicted metalloprotease with PDZ domain